MGTLAMAWASDASTARRRERISMMCFAKASNGAGAHGVMVPVRAQRRVRVDRATQALAG